jgi:hypothetical protein
VVQGGTTYKVTPNQLLGAGGTATLASATITGDLTVDTSTLKVDSTNNRVGIATATPAEKLTIDNTLGGAAVGFRVFAGDQSTARIAVQNTNGQAYHLVAGNPGVSNAGFALYDNTAAATRYYVDSTGIQTWSVAGTTAMTLNSTGLGVGVTPSAWGSTYKAAQLTGGASVSYGTGTMAVIQNSYDSAAGSFRYVAAASSAASFYQQTAGTHEWSNASAGTAGNLINGGTGAWTSRMLLDASGNLLVGVTSTNVNGGVLQLKSGITFPATQVASSDANTLDDYEEGTFVPTIGGTATYTIQNGRYTKIGNRVYVNMRLIVLLIGTGVNNIISGLPFAVGASANLGSVSIGYFANLAISANYISGYANTGTSTVTMTATTAATANITNGAAVIGNATDLALSFFYEV